MADKQLVITGGKQGPIYLAKALNLGGYQPTANNTNVFEVSCRLAALRSIISAARSGRDWQNGLLPAVWQIATYPDKHSM